MKLLRKGNNYEIKFKRLPLETKNILQTENGSLVFLSLFISSIEVCNTAYALLRIHEQNLIFEDTTK